MSPGNKGKAGEFRELVDRSAAALGQGLHLVVIDPFPPTRRDPNGVHAAIWRRLRSRPAFRLPDGQPLCATGYQAGPGAVRAYIEPFAAGRPVPPVPLFLPGGRHVMLPLEDTYVRAFAKLPGFWRDRLEATP